jgi:hypothetical protein
VAFLIVDGANVVGSVPDGWWRDRRAAATRLRDALAGLATDGLGRLTPPLEVVLVVEGAARPLADEDGGRSAVRVQAAPGSGDDAIVALVAAAKATERTCLVVTADRGLRERVYALGAMLAGPRVLPYQGRGGAGGGRAQ